MGKRQALAYVAVCTFIYLVVAAIYLIAIDCLLDIFSTAFFFHLTAFLFVLVVIDPVITYLIVEKMPFKAENLKVPDGLEKDLKKEVDVIKDVQ